jgi:hypothetical protein
MCGVKFSLTPQAVPDTSRREETLIFIARVQIRTEKSLHIANLCCDAFLYLAVAQCPTPRK